MSRFRIELAGADRDADLRRIASTPMPGKISLAFHREPSFCDANCVLGPDRQTIACWDQQTGGMVGLAMRSVRQLYVNGIPTRIGYLSALRFVPEARNFGLLARGYRFLRELHENDPCRPDFYLTTIAEGNHRAIDILTSGRAGLPNYRFLGRLSILALPRRTKSPAANGCEVITAREETIDIVLEFLNKVGSTRPFFPVYAKSDLVGSEPVFRDLRPTDTKLICRQGQVVGVVGMWNQRAFRQTVVQGYGGLLRVGRRVYNQWARIVSQPRLPAPGTPLRHCFAAFPLVNDHDPEVSQCLLDTLTETSPNDCDYTMIGLCDNDPLLPLARRYRWFEYQTRIYAVSWDPSAAIQTLPEQPYYLESGCL